VQYAVPDSVTVVYPFSNNTQRPLGRSPQALRRHEQMSADASTPDGTCVLLSCPGSRRLHNTKLKCQRRNSSHTCTTRNSSVSGETARIRAVTQVSIGAQVLTLLVRVVEGEGGRRAILPRLRAEVVVEARAGGHRLGVEVGREGAILPDRTSSVSTQFIGRFNCNAKLRFPRRNKPPSGFPHK